MFILPSYFNIIYFSLVLAWSMSSRFCGLVRWMKVTGVNLSVNLGRFDHNNGLSAATSKPWPICSDHGISLDWHQLYGGGHACWFFDRNPNGLYLY